MKTLKLLTALALVLITGFTAKTYGTDDERLNLPGDNLNLYAVMDIFRESETLEDFERTLNAQDAKINNLDLNGDNLIDYIKVIDYVENDAHTIVLQVAINKTENQDVAVFTVYKDNRGLVHVQLIGDEDLYGKDYIIEPNYADETSTPNPGYAGKTKVVRNETVVVTRTTYVEVAAWPVVRFIYLPSYVVWHSPWYWGYYPAYWSPWHPYYWDYYYGYHYPRYHHYNSWYRHSHHHSYPHYATYYYHGHRSHSNVVRSYRDNGRYRDTYSRPDLRKEGTSDYRRDYADNGRSFKSNASNPRSNVKSGSRSGTGRSVAKPETARPSTRQTAKPSDTREIKKTEPRNANRSADRSSVKPSGKREINKAEPRQGKGSVDRKTERPSGKSEINKAEPRKGNDRQSVRSGESHSSVSQPARTSGRSEVNKAARNTGGNKSASPAKRSGSKSGDSKSRDSKRK